MRRCGARRGPAARAGRGCASAAAARRAEERAAAADAAGWAAWRALLEGASADGPRPLSRGAPAQPEHPLALFGEAALAFERGRTEALSTRPWPCWRSPSSSPPIAGSGPLAGRGGHPAADAAGRGRLAQAVRGPRCWPCRPAALPWRARLALEEARDNIARRRGDGALLRGSGLSQGCLPSMQLARQRGAASPPGPRASRRARAPPSPPVHSKPPAVCLTLPAREGRPGVHVVAGPDRHDRRAGGPRARLRRTGARPDRRREPSSSTASARTFGPRASAVSVTSLPAAHSGRAAARQLRRGGPAARLPVRPGPARAGAADPGRAPSRALWELRDRAAAPTPPARPTGRWPRRQALRQRPRFALGLAAAAAVLARDPTRPSGMARDEADALYRAVVARRSRPGPGGAGAGAGRAAPGPQRGGGRAGPSRRRAPPPASGPPRPPQIEALRARGLERQADQVLEQALAQLGAVEGACDLLLQAHQRAQIRYQTEAEKICAERLAAATPARPCPSSG